LALPHLPAEIQPECKFTMLEAFNAIIEYANGIKEFIRTIASFFNWIYSKLLV